MQRRRLRPRRGAWRPYLAVGPLARGYPETLALQHRIQEARLAGRIPDVLLLVEHPPTVTLGRGLPRRVPVRRRDPGAPVAGAAAEVAGAALRDDPGGTGRVHEAPRGGGVALHGPGTLTGYLVASLKDTDRSLPGTVERMERGLCRLLGEYHLVPERVAGIPGIWLGGARVASLGLGLRSFVTGHGFALNVHPDLEALRALVPEDVEDPPATSLGEHLGEDAPDLEDVALGLFQHLGSYLELRTRHVELAELEAELA